MVRRQAVRDALMQAGLPETRADRIAKECKGSLTAAFMMLATGLDEPLPWTLGVNARRLAPWCLRGNGSRVIRKIVKPSQSWQISLKKNWKRHWRHGVVQLARSFNEEVSWIGWAGILHGNCRPRPLTSHCGIDLWNSSRKYYKRLTRKSNLSLMIVGLQRFAVNSIPIRMHFVPD